MPLEGFVKRFPELTRVAEPRVLLEDPEVQLIVCAGIPGERAAIAIQAMRHGKDVMVDKPGVITAEQLDAVRRSSAETGRIWSVNFSERFEVRAMTRAQELVAAGALGRVVQTVGFGPHRLNRHLRPPWFFDRGAGRRHPRRHRLAPGRPVPGLHRLERRRDRRQRGRQLRQPREPGVRGLRRDPAAQRCARAATSGSTGTRPDGLPTWGDGRCTILGTEGYIELRKYVDIAGRDGTDHLFLVDREATRHVDCRDAPLPYYERLIADVFERTETAMPQAHCFKVCELARRGAGRGGAARLTARAAPPLRRVVEDDAERVALAGADAADAVAHGQAIEAAGAGRRALS